MGFSLSKSRYSPIGIDFGAESLKLLQIVPTDPPQMVAAAAVRIPQAVRKDPAARYAFLTEQLRTLVRQQGFKGKRVICSIPAYQTLVQNLEVARSDQDDLDEQIAQQMRQRLNVDPTRMVVRHYGVGQIVRDGSARQEVVCLAASREAVIRYLEVCHRAKLDVVGMHAEPPALLASFAHLYRRQGDDQRTTCFLDIGAATTKVIIAHGSKMAFAKTIHAAGDQFTKAVAQARNLSFEDARTARLAEMIASSPTPAPGPAPAPAPGSSPSEVTTGASRGLDPRIDPDDASLGNQEMDADPTIAAPTAMKVRSGGLAILEAQLAAQADPAQAVASTAAPRSSATPAPGLTPGLAPGLTPAPATAAAAMAAIVGDALDCLIDELQMCVRYHNSRFPERNIEKLVFLGGEARNTPACQKIARTLRIGAQLGDPLARMVRVSQAHAPHGVDMRQPQPGWAVTMGLCLSEANL
jgi:type IV pilus assembly protein PilM